ncbi:hypothetical protein M405DRAFT_864136 [Rhizopogon salebrosus TDB-379]|nr:hypothetical protein M405DRAFT_864136 [Rhizopogon salebrosus TDB-379]
MPAELGDQWTSCVLDKGESITEAFLSNETLPDPLSLSERAREMLTIDAKPTNPADVLRAHRKVICPVCTIDSSKPFMVEDGPQAEAHRHSRVHRARASRAVRIKKKASQPVSRSATVDRDVPMGALDTEDQQGSVA